MGGTIYIIAPLPYKEKCPAHQLIRIDQHRYTFSIFYFFFCSWHGTTTETTLTISLFPLPVPFEIPFSFSFSFSFSFFGSCLPFPMVVGLSYTPLFSLSFPIPFVTLVSKPNLSPSSTSILTISVILFFPTCSSFNLEAEAWFPSRSLPTSLFRFSPLASTVLSPVTFWNLIGTSLVSCRCRQKL